MKTLSIIIPVYNEKKTIMGILDAVQKCNAAGLNKEIVLIDDCSTDGSREILSDLKKTGEYKILFQDKNRGKGAAIRMGFQNATGDFVIIQDADLEYDPNEYEHILEPLIQNRADVVYGSRFMGDKPHRVLLFWHSVGNKLLTTFSNICTNLNLTDMETCYKAFTREAIQKILPSLRSNRFGIEPEITALVAAQRLRIFEVGISYSGRTYDEGKKIGWKDGLSAVWTIIYSHFRLLKDQYKFWLVPFLIFVAVFSIGVFHPQIEGDSVSYAENIEVLRTGIEPAGFVPYRLLTTILGLRFIMLVDFFVGNLWVSWLLVNVLFFVTMALAFYSLAKKIFDKTSAFIATLFLALNYASVSFGLAYLMDVGGWAFYMMAILFAYSYLKSGKDQNMIASAVFIGAGGLFKECAFPAALVLSAVIIYKFRREWRSMIERLLAAGLVIFVPVFILNIYTYIQYDYTYLSWMISNQNTYVYHSRIVEFIKSFGSLYNFGWFIFIPGLYIYIKKIRLMISERKIDEDLLFIGFVILSGLSVLVWAAITQRILFTAMPAIVLISTLYIQTLKKKWRVILPILVLYVLSSYLMDSVLLQIINL